MFLGYALGAAFASIHSKGLSPDQGHSPGMIFLLSAGHGHRRTSGGKAEPAVAHYIRGRAAEQVSNKENNH
jgi:hypothetical protein